jgi:hypothetical protein
MPYYILVRTKVSKTKKPVRSGFVGLLKTDGFNLKFFQILTNFEIKNPKKLDLILRILVKTEFKTRFLSSYKNRGSLFGCVKQIKTHLSLLLGPPNLHRHPQLPQDSTPPLPALPTRSSPRSDPVHQKSATMVD